MRMADATRPDWSGQRFGGLLAYRDLLLLWTMRDGRLAPLAVRTGIVGEKLTQVLGAELGAELQIAMPRARKDSTRRRRFGLSLF